MRRTPQPRARFHDRRSAGRELAARLSHLHDDHAVVLALPRGGVPVGAEVARVLGGGLDVLVVRKLGCPWQPELGVGAIGEGGVVVRNDRLLEQLGVTESELAAVTRREHAELVRRLEAYRGGRPPLPLDGRVVVVVDDGVATGVTMAAALQVVRRHTPSRLVLAVPVAPPDTLERLRPLVDEAVVLHTDLGGAVGTSYDDFTQTGDAEVCALVAEFGAASTRAVPGPSRPRRP